MLSQGTLRLPHLAARIFIDVAIILIVHVKFEEVSICEFMY